MHRQMQYEARSNIFICITSFLLITSAKSAWNLVRLSQCMPMCNDSNNNNNKRWDFLHDSINLFGFCGIHYRWNCFPRLFCGSVWLCTNQNARFASQRQHDAVCSKILENLLLVSQVATYSFLCFFFLLLALIFTFEWERKMCVLILLCDFGERFSFYLLSKIFIVVDHRIINLNEREQRRMHQAVLCDWNK